MVLASGSASRAAMLIAAGVPFRAVRPSVDEEELKRSLRARALSPRDQADALAEMKALSVSRREPGIVIGADQMGELDDGATWDKPRDRAEAAAQLRRLSGRSHRLHSAAVACEDGRPVWRAVATATLQVRALSEAFIDGYLAAEGDDALFSVGVYRVEGRGAQLFERVEGDHWTIMGLPMLPLLAWLRARGIMAA